MAHEPVLSEIRGAACQAVGHMGTRALSLTQEAENFLMLLVAAGSIPGERPSRFVSVLTQDAYNAVFKHIPEGTLPGDPSYQGPDPHFERYSRYSFIVGELAGTYTCSPDHVIILDLRINGRVPAEAAELGQAVA